MKFSFLRTFKVFACLIFISLWSAQLKAQYCTPAFLQGCAFGDEFNDFVLLGESGTSINDLATGCVGTVFGGYDNRTSESVTLKQGTSYTLSIDNSSSSILPDNFQVWIDFNDNNTFEATESVAGGVMPTTIFGTATGALTNFTLIIPAGATLGSHRMRAEMSGSETYPSINPCPTIAGSGTNGEVHDYTVVIVAGTTGTCPAVTGLTVSAITASSATLSWTAATGAIGYEWAVTTSATPPASGTATTATTANATGLTASTAYYAHVRTKCSATSFSSWVSVPFTTTGTTTTCTAPTLTLGAGTSTTQVVNWMAITGATGYEWVVNTTATAPTGSGTATTLTTFTATGLTAATTYYAHVRTNCGTSFSTWTTIPFTTGPSTAGCNPVTGLTASAITASSATISWTAVTGSVGYQYVINNTVAAPTGSGTNIATTTYNATALTAGTTYYVHVRDSCGATSLSAWNTIPFTTLSTTCNAVTSLTASSITTNSATITWVRPTGTVAAQYVINTNPADPTVSGTTTTLSTYNATGLTSSTTYYAHVRDTCGATALSAWVTIPITTLASGVGVINVNVDNGFGISAFPNPVSGALTVEIQGGLDNEGMIQVMDVTGKLLKVMPATDRTVSIDMSGLSSGLYLVRYSDAAHAQTIKVNKQ